MTTPPEGRSRATSVSGSRLWTNSSPESAFRAGRASPSPKSYTKRPKARCKLWRASTKSAFERIQDSSEGQDKTPPAMIIVCDNTDIAKVFFEKISGETTQEIVDEENGSGRRRRRKKRVRSPTIRTASVFPELFSNTENDRRTLRIDSKLLADAESGRASGSAKQAARRPAPHG